MTVDDRIDAALSTLSPAQRRTLIAHLEGLASWGVSRIPVDRDRLERLGADARREAARSKLAGATRGDPGRDAGSDSRGRGTDGESERSSVSPSDRMRGSRPDPRSPSRPRPGTQNPGPKSTPARTIPVEDPLPRFEGDKRAALAELAAQVAPCTKCALAPTRTQTVFGVGDPDARLMFVGEAPGLEEDRRGEPFVGRAGQLLDRIIGALGLTRDAVYIANVLKCRPPENRTPNADEVAHCSPYLARQIEIIGPEMIVALGRPSANLLLGVEKPLGLLRGRRHQYRGVPVVVTYHPAYLLRRPEEKAKTWADLQVVIRELGLAPPSARKNPAD